MTRQRNNFLAAAAALTLLSLGILASSHLWQPPSLVASLRNLPAVAKIVYCGSSDSPLIVVHLRDWHFVPRDLCHLDGIDFDANLAAVATVQDDELAIARFLIREHGFKEVFSEGLSKQSMPDLRLRLDVLKELDRLEELGGMDSEARQHRKELTLEVGIPGRLLFAGEIDKVLPLEDVQALKEAGPILVEEEIRFDSAKLEKRRNAMVAQLPARGMALIVLGGSHDLLTYFRSDVFYVRVTPRSYPGDD